MFSWIRLVVGFFLLFCGLFVFLVEVVGVYRFRYVLNRMHAAATGDTLGIALSMAGLMVLSGFRFATLKMGLVVLFLWFASPVSSHLIARLEVTTNEGLERDCTVSPEAKRASEIANFYTQDGVSEWELANGRKEKEEDE